MFKHLSEMSKRRRASSSSRACEEDAVNDLEPSTSVGPSRSKRKKTFDPNELCHQLYEIIRNYKKSDGSLLCDSFIRVPKRRQEPKYYDVVSNPIDLLKIQQKLKTEEYEDIEELQCDIELIVNNTKAFYKKCTQEYKDANELWELFLSSKNKLMNIEDDSNKLANNKTPLKITKKVFKVELKIEGKNSVNHKLDLNNSLDDEDMYEELFTAVMKAKDENNKPLYTHFQLLPSQKKYPEYYEVIEQPIDLRHIAQKMQGKKYNHLIEMERDLLLMCKNACLFNEPGSQIHKQAKALKQFIQTRKWMEKIRTPKLKNNGTNNTGRIRKVERTSTPVTPALKEESENEELISSLVDAVEDANEVDNTADEHENTQDVILNIEESNSQDSTMGNVNADNVAKAKENVTIKKQFESSTLGHVPSRKRRCNDSLVNEAYEVMTQTLAV